MANKVIMKGTDTWRVAGYSKMICHRVDDGTRSCNVVDQAIAGKDPAFLFGIAGIENARVLRDSIASMKGDDYSFEFFTKTEYEVKDEDGERTVIASSMMR